MVKTVQFYLMDISAGIDNERSFVDVFGRTKDGEKICVREYFKPYFWVILEDKVNSKRLVEKIKNIRLKAGDKVISPSSASFEKRKFIGNEVNAVKVVINSKTDLAALKPEIKEMKGVDKIQETDIQLVRRYLIDKKLVPLTLCEVSGNLIRSDFKGEFLRGRVRQVSSDTIKPKVLAFDIETYNRGMMPVDTEDSILTIAFKGDNFEKVISWTKFETSDEKIEFVKDEKALIEEFVKIVDEYNPDYIIGYFSDGFDFPYLKSRADKLDVKIDIDVKRRLGTSKAMVKDIVHLDIFKFIKNIMGGSLRIDSFSLGSVAKELIKEDKLQVDAKEAARIFDDGNDKEIEEFCLYNLQDAVLTFKLFNKIIPNLNEIVKLVSQSIFDVCRTHFGQLAEWYLMRRVKEFNEIYPNKPGINEISGRRRQSYEGAFVLEPEPGVYDNIAVLDFRSIYPSIISAKNICLSTLTKDKNHANETPDVDGERFYFDYKIEGFMPKIITDLIQRRIRIKEIIKKEGKEDAILNARSYGLKTLANAFYGYLGFFGARWYAIECSASITAYGRDYIKKVMDKAKEEGFKVLYSDTDSIMVSLGKRDKKDAFSFIKEMNRELPSLMELELEDFYKRGIFVVKKGESKGAKKKYALLDYENKIKVRGFETVRRDWSYIAREVQKKVIELVLKGDDSKKALEYAKEKLNEIREKKIPVAEMVIQTQLRRDIGDYEQIGPHVAVARRMIKRGLNVGPGSIIKYIITEGDGMIRDRARLVEEAENYDPEYYINHQILPAVEKIFEVLGCKREDLLKEKEQSKIEDF